MARIIHFDIAAEDPERAMTFYERLFGWEFVKASGPYAYWLIKTGDDEEPGIDGGLAPRDADWQTVTCFIDVDSIDEVLTRIEDEGGTVLKPRTVVPGVGFIAAIEDTEGNPIGLIEQSESAGF